MPALEPLCHLAGINFHNLLKEERFILEADLFVYLHEELKETIKQQQKDYFRLLKINPKKENSMIEPNLIRCIINDILSTEEYSLPGIAYYTDFPEDIIFDIATGRNTNPSLLLAVKIIALHRSVRPKLYQGIFKKITKKDSEAA